MSGPVPRFVVGFGLVLAVFFASSGAADSRPAAAPNLVRNGGFEQPLVAVGGYQLVYGGKSFGGWRVVGPLGTNVAPISGSYQQNGISFTARAGAQWLDLTGGLSNQPIGVAQTVETRPGASYRLSFTVGNVVDPGGVFGTSSTVNVLVNGHKVLAATNRGGGKVQAWKTFTLTLKATTATTTIEFQNGDPVTDNDNGLDAVSLTPR